MATGTVKWFNNDKGYGFITPEDGGKDLFVHHNGIAGEGFKRLPEGAKVEFVNASAMRPPPPAPVDAVPLPPQTSTRPLPARLLHTSQMLPPDPASCPAVDLAVMVPLTVRVLAAAIFTAPPPALVYPPLPSEVGCVREP